MADEQQAVLLPITGARLTVQFIDRLRASWSGKPVTDSLQIRARNVISHQSESRLRTLIKAAIPTLSDMAKARLDRVNAQRAAEKKATAKKKAKKKAASSKGSRSKGRASADLDVANGLYSGKLIRLHLLCRKTCRTSQRSANPGASDIAVFNRNGIAVIGSAKRGKSSIELPDHLPAADQDLVLLSIEYEFDGNRYTHPFTKHPSVGCNANWTVLDGISYDKVRGFIG